MKPSFAERDKNQNINVPLLSVPHSLFSRSSVQQGELFFPFKFDWLGFFP